MYLYDIEDYIDESDVDWEDFYKESKPPHKNAGDALYSLMEQLYNSKVEIDVDVIKSDFIYLCEKLGVKNEFIENSKDLCVVHKSIANKLKTEYHEKMKVIKDNATELKRQLCGDSDEVDIVKTTSALREICIRAETPMYWGQRVNIARENWQLIGRKDLLQLAKDLIKNEVV